jgi:hypothetical protein
MEMRRSSESLSEREKAHRERRRLVPAPSDAATGDGEGRRKVGWPEPRGND